MQNLVSHHESSPSPNQAAQLKNLLQEKFPSAARPEFGDNTKLAPRKILSSGLPSLDKMGLPQGTLSEVYPSGPGSSGISLLLVNLLETQASSAIPLALIDLHGRCDFVTLGSLCERLLWIHCEQPTTSLQVTELLVRDGNLPIILLDLTSLSLREQNQIAQPSHWHKLRQFSEASGTTLIVLTHRHCLPGSHHHFQLQTTLPLDAPNLPRQELYQHLTVATPSRPQFHPARNQVR